ncbi:hypothetical protein BS333_14455 [Vibrio azureus]|uniref:Uncharacterized protein n=1 Tax=Vibrio azureus NBRC 104587 TaxID=1219077 RepID=U3AMR1_9VIBR|nr:hypothetical protein [Vibrio azureus]AUI87611.1 hypothetical protein BS333_14455 [Vibrio azureus]GAD74587.1 hypothetical protein VAZ01S_012_00680 [Vibrio azureus NBRC 104587]
MKVLQLAVVVLMLIAGYFAPSAWESLTSKTDVTPLNAYCMLSTTPCVQQNIVMISHADFATPFKPFKIEVEWPNTTQSQLVLTLRGYDMEMGKPQFTLHRTPQNTFVGEIVLPICTQDSMIWIGELSDGSTTLHPAITMKK